MYVSIFLKKKINDVLNFIVRLFLDFLRTIPMLFCCTAKRFSHEPLLAWKIEQSLPTCTFLTLNQLSYPIAFQNDLNEPEKFGWKNELP